MHKNQRWKHNKISWFFFWFLKPGMEFLNNPKKVIDYLNLTFSMYADNVENNLK